MTAGNGHAGVDAVVGGPVVVGVDPSDSARAAALWAADLAAACGLGLDLVHVAPDRPRTLPAWLREIADAARLAGTTPVTTEVACGSPFDVLLTRSHRAGLVVVGSFGRDTPAGLSAGSTALGLVARAGCPVAVVRGTEEGLAPPRSGPVVAGVDGTLASDPALRLAGGLAAALGAPLSAVHAWSDVRVGAGGVHRAAESWSELAQLATRGLDEQLDRVVPGVPVERRLVAGTPVRSLLDLAGTARMVVVAQRDRPPAGGVHLGSTSRGLVEFAPCPVVVARGGHPG